MSSIPDDFGALNGTEVANRDTFFAELDEILGRTPTVEYILVRPLSSINILKTGIGTHANSYGHSAVRYFYKGKWYIMNIVGKEEKNGINMVTFPSPEDYFFSTKYDDEPGCQQRGLYNRSMIGIRVYDVPEKKVEMMHNFFLETQKRNYAGKAGFLILPQLMGIYSAWNKFVHHKETPELGNCSYWTSKGLLSASLVTHYSNWPKSVLINMIENSKYEYDVVSYRRIEHAKLSYGIKASPLEFVAPFNTFRSYFYMYPENFAKAIVEVPQNSTIAEIRKHEPIQMASPLRNVLNTKLLVGTSVAITSYGTYRFFRYTYRGGKSWVSWVTRYETWRGKNPSGGSGGSGGSNPPNKPVPPRPLNNPTKRMYSTYRPNYKPYVRRFFRFFK